MNKVNLKQKLSSRKFWAAAVSYITGILTAFNISDNVIVQVTAILGGVGALAVYILAEAYVDGKRKENAASLTSIEETVPASYSPVDEKKDGD